MLRRLLLVGACASLVLSSLPVGLAAADAPAPPTLVWRSCGGSERCSTLTVPLDDTVTGGPTIDLALVRIRARDRSRRLGSLLVNPGGPGASGVDYVLNAASSLPSELRNRFDIVGFDPRGAGQSSGVDCTDNLDSLVALDWAPTTVTARKRLVAGMRRLVKQCERADGPILPYLSTSRAARDLDRIRAALGDDKLTYLGYSYGTYLGAWYAEQFPERVRALVLDGAVDPALDATEIQVQQAAAFERDLNLFLHDCATRRDCTFHGADHPGRAYDGLRARIARQPLSTHDLGKGRTLNTTEFDIGITSVLYSGRIAWADLADALQAADRGDGSALLASADEYAGRNFDGTYNNLQESFLAIGCADGPPVGNLAALRKIEEKAAIAAPRLGRSIVNNSMACALWPVAAPAPRPLHATGAPPILVLGTRNDPATPLAWAKGLAGELDSGVLVTVGGERHTAFTSGNGCVDDAVVRYFVDLVVPRTGTTC